MPIECAFAGLEIWCRLFGRDQYLVRREECIISRGYQNQTQEAGSQPQNEMKPKNLSNIFLSGVASKHRPSSAADDAVIKVVNGSEVSSRLPGDVSSILLSGGSRYHWESNKSLEHLNVEPLQRKEAIRENKLMFIFGNHQCGRFNKLVDMCANRFGTPTTIHVFDRLGRVNSVQEGNALIKRSIEGARMATDEAAAENEMQHAFHVFKDMKEQGFPLEDETQEAGTKNYA